MHGVTSANLGAKLIVKAFTDHRRSIKKNKNDCNSLLGICHRLSWKYLFPLLFLVSCSPPHQHHYPADGQLCNHAILQQGLACSHLFHSTHSDIAHNRPLCMCEREKERKREAKEIWMLTSSRAESHGQHGRFNDPMRKLPL